ncbi:metallophosphoesterase [Paraburkholderia sp. IMGN_8]|uniref:metallophosphoesterase n=1 Tax=Paraburkholderia sp. IMGN_8 TaxID=3136564 RepID=UPI0031011841
MKIQIASDLHHEMAQHRADLAAPLPVTRETDVLVLAGDIHEGSRAIDLYSGCRVPVVYVTGNHEPLGHDYQKLLSELRERAQGTSVRFLQDDELVLGNVRFLGATLWTDYSLYPLRLNDAMRAAGAAMVEHKGIKQGSGRFFRPEDAREHQGRTLRWLRERLDESFDGKTVVVTHHAPSGMSIPQKNRAHVLAAAYASNVELLVIKADLWIHGHIHASSDYRIGDCRVICNPRGRPGKNRDNPDVPYENANFDPSLVIEL